MFLTEKGTTHPTDRRKVLLAIVAVALVAALAMTIQSKALQGAIMGYNASMSEAIRATDILQFQSECPECLEKYTACTSPIRKRRDYSAERIAKINKDCSEAYTRCRNREQCFR